MSSHTYLKWFAVCRGFVLLILVWLVTGCVSTPEKSSEGKTADTIEVTENRSVDLAVREDFNTAVTLLRAEKYEEAIELLKKVIMASQNNSSPYVNIAIAYSNIGKITLAEDNLKKAIEINPLHPVTLNEYALLYRKTGRYTEARALYQKLLERYPQFTPARKNYGILCELYLNDAPCAMTQYQAYLEASPQDEEVKLWLTGLQR